MLHHFEKFSELSNRNAYGKTLLNLQIYFFYETQENAQFIALSMKNDAAISIAAKIVKLTKLQKRDPTVGRPKPG